MILTHNAVRRVANLLCSIVLSKLVTSLLSPRKTFRVLKCKLMMMMMMMIVEEDDNGIFV